MPRTRCSSTPATSHKMCDHAENHASPRQTQNRRSESHAENPGGVYYVHPPGPDVDHPNHPNHQDTPSVRHFAHLTDGAA